MTHDVCPKCDYPGGAVVLHGSADPSCPRCGADMFDDSNEGDAMRAEKMTPGPWQFGLLAGDDADSRTGTDRCILDDAGDVLAYVLLAGQDTAKRAPTRDANARAIAEVPAMVEALRRVADAFDAPGMALAKTRGSITPREQLAVDARAILARIDGDGR